MRARQSLLGARHLALLVVGCLAVACAKRPPVASPAAASVSASPTSGTPVIQPDPVLAAAFSESLEVVGATGPRAVAKGAPGRAPSAPIISGRIILARARTADVAKGQTMFIAIRRADGAPGPGSLLAAQRLEVEAFPRAFTLSEGDALIPAIGLGGGLSITVRVDKDGDPMTRRPGDVYGTIARVKLGARNVVVTLDRLQSEAETLAPPADSSGARAVETMGALPPGHPVLGTGTGNGLPLGHP